MRNPEANLGSVPDRLSALVCQWIGASRFPHPHDSRVFTPACFLQIRSVIVKLHLVVHKGHSTRPKFAPCLTYRIEFRLFALADYGHGAEKDAQVQPQRGVPHIPDVERGLIRGRELSTTFDLCPP